MEPMRVGDGRMLRYFALPDAAGRRFDLEQFQRQRGLVIFFGHADCDRCAALLRDYTAHAATIRDEGAEPVVVLDAPPRLGGPITVLVDEEGKAVQVQGLHIPALLVADRYGEVYAAWQGGADHALPSGEDVTEWVVSVERLCEECTISEWSQRGREGE